MDMFTTISNRNITKHISLKLVLSRRLCGLVVRVLSYRSGGPGSIPGTTRFSEKEKEGNK
jgi:hypothetical protein